MRKQASMPTEPPAVQRRYTFVPCRMLLSRCCFACIGVFCLLRNALQYALRVWTESAPRRGQRQTSEL